MPFTEFPEIKEFKKIKGKIPIWHLYTVGVGGDIFFKGLKQGKIIAGYCEGCGSFILPPRIYCPDCFIEIEEFKEVKGPFVVKAVTEVYRDIDENRFKKPVKIGIITLWDAKGGIVHLLNPEEDIEIGDTVIPVFEKKRKGALTDIKYFKLKR
jgi:hypothetical protein